MGNIKIESKREQSKASFQNAEHEQSRRNVKIIKGVFDTKLELEHAGIKAGFPSPADDYRRETLDFNRDYIRHPEASFYGDVDGDSMRDAEIH